MKRLLIVLAVALLVPVAASADPIAVGDIVTVSDPGSRFGSGGPFQITKAGETPFLTFCIETNEYFNWGDYRVARIDTVAILGGAGGGSPDPLNYETAWLYTQFRGLTRRAADGPGRCLPGSHLVLRTGDGRREQRG